VLFWVGRKVRRAIRRRRTPRIHPKLLKYSGDVPDPAYEELAAKRRLEADRICATSSTTNITGYDIIEQIEAVYVDGFRRPEDALVGLKAAAAMKGANAVVNVHHDRTASGKCSASGDAVVVRKMIIASASDDTPPEIPTG